MGLNDAYAKDVIVNANVSESQNVINVGIDEIMSDRN